MFDDGSQFSFKRKKLIIFPSKGKVAAIIEHTDLSLLSCRKVMAAMMAATWLPSSPAIILVFNVFLLFRDKWIILGCPAAEFSSNGEKTQLGGPEKKKAATSKKNPPKTGLIIMAYSKKKRQKSRVQHRILRHIALVSATFSIPPRYAGLPSPPAYHNFFRNPPGICDFPSHPG